MYQLALPGSAVLDGEAFAAAATQLPASQLTAAIANLLLGGCPDQAAVGSAAASAHPQQLRGLAAVLPHIDLPPLEEGAPSLAQLVASCACSQPVFDQATVALFGLQQDLRQPEQLPLLAAARRGSTVMACTSAERTNSYGVCMTTHCWWVQGKQVLAECSPAGWLSARECTATVNLIVTSAPALNRGLPATFCAPHRCKFQFDGGELVQSACSCGMLDFGVLWCQHRMNAAAALASWAAGLPQLVDLDGLTALLAPLPTTHLARLLLQLALVTQSIPEVVEALGLPPAALFLPCLGGLLLSLPNSSQPRAATGRVAGGGEETKRVLDMCCFARFPAQQGYLVDAVAAVVQPTSAPHIWQQLGVGVDPGGWAGRNKCASALRNCAPPAWPLQLRHITPATLFHLPCS